MSKISCNFAVKLGPVKRQSLSGLTRCIENYMHGGCSALFENWMMRQVVACDGIIGDFFDKIFFEICIHNLIILFAEIFVVTNSLYKRIELVLCIAMIN